MAGRLLAGTSGFAYPDWAPAFYPTGLPATGLLPAYAARLPACELNTTYYRIPSPERVAAWAAAVPPSFRFDVKAQRGTAIRAFSLDAPGSVARLVDPLRGLGDRLGGVLFRVPRELPRDDRRLAALLQAWPPGIPLTLDLQHPSWEDDGVIAMARAAGAALCATDADESPEPPTIRLTGPHLYLRLRRTAYSAGELAGWAARIRPFLDAGHDVHVYLRHDETGASALRALDLVRLVEAAAA